MENSKTTKINPEKTALVIIDLQKGIAKRELAAHSSEEVIGNSTKLIDSFTNNNGFVVLVRVSTDGKDFPNPSTDLAGGQMNFPEGWDIYIPEIADTKNAHKITKRQWGAFYGTDLDLQLRRRGIDTIVLSGISTNIGVDTTAREAYQHGYNQIFVEDAMAAMTQEEHDFTCKYIFPKIGKIRSTEEVLSALK